MVWFPSDNELRWRSGAVKSDCDCVACSIIKIRLKKCRFFFSLKGETRSKNYAYRLALALDAERCTGQTVS